MVSFLFHCLVVVVLNIVFSFPFFLAQTGCSLILEGINFVQQIANSGTETVENISLNHLLTFDSPV